MLLPRFVIWSRYKQGYLLYLDEKQNQLFRLYKKAEDARMQFLFTKDQKSY